MNLNHGNDAGKDPLHQNQSAFAGDTSHGFDFNQLSQRGRSIQASALEDALSHLLPNSQEHSTSDDSKKSPPVNSKFGDFNEDPDSPLHVDANKLANVQSVEALEGQSKHLNNRSAASKSNGRDVTLDADDLLKNLGDKGNILAPGGRTNTLVGGDGNDLFVGNVPEVVNTIATGPGKDNIVLGEEATDRILDFDPKRDVLSLSNLKFDDLLFGQGTKLNGGIDQPLDSKNSTVVIDKNGDHILASLPFVDSSDLSAKNFVQVSQSGIDKAEMASAVSPSSGGKPV